MTFKEKVVIWVSKSKEKKKYYLILRNILLLILHKQYVFVWSYMFVVLSNVLKKVCKFHLDYLMASDAIFEVNFL